MTDAAETIEMSGVGSALHVPAHLPLPPPPSGCTGAARHDNAKLISTKILRMRFNNKEKVSFLQAVLSSNAHVWTFVSVPKK